MPQRPVSLLLKARCEFWVRLLDIRAKCGTNLLSKSDRERRASDDVRSVFEEEPNHRRLPVEENVCEWN
jgi:hypothetical protein